MSSNLDKAGRTYPEKWRLVTQLEDDWTISADSKGVYIERPFNHHAFICWKDLGALQAATFEEHLGENGELRAVHVAAGIIAAKVSK